jgi:hypothetical protein
MRIDPQIRKLSQTTFEVQSYRNPLEIYRVENRRGIWLCSCPHFQWRCSGGTDCCKHIQLVHLRHPESLGIKFKQRPMVGQLLVDMLKV